MQRVGTVRALYRYPVKSTAGQTLEAAEVDARGLVADRTWAVYTADGGIGSGKTSRRFRKLDGLLRWRSLAEDGRDGTTTWLHAPDGTRLAAGDPGADAALSEAFGQPLALRAERTAPHHDDCGVHLVTTSSLRGAGLLADGVVDGRRLRPNVVLETEGSTFLEDGWEQAELALGPAVVLRLGPGMPRCVMVDQPQHDVPAGRPLLRALGREHDLLLGIQAEVLVPGTVRTGDEAWLRAG